MGRPSSPGFGIGAVVKKWTVVGITKQERIGGATRDAYVCRCECGREQTIEKSRLKTNAPMQCRSCTMRETRRRHGAHGQTLLPEYHVWSAMKARCINPEHAMYKNYGARGITVAARWLEFDNFYVDMGPRPTPNHTLERQNNGKGYSKANCVWATQKAQSRNKRNNRLLSVGAETLTVAEWAARLNTSSAVVAGRVDKHGWTLKDACTIPVLRRAAYKKRQK